jgi:hypothetical protein
MLHVLPISSSLTWSFYLYLANSTSCEAHHYAAFSNQVSHSYRTTGKIIILYIIIFMFLDSRREDKGFWTEW